MPRAAGSSNGRIEDSESFHLGSNPGPAALGISTESVYLVLSAASKKLIPLGYKPGSLQLYLTVSVFPPEYMQKIKTNKICKIIDKICSGQFDSSDTGMLFILLRPTFSHNMMLQDLSNFIAHGDKRDRGVSFDHINKFVKNILEVSEKGGTLVGLPPVFNKENVIEDLIKALNNLDLVIESNKIRAQKEKLIDNLLELMEESEFSFEDSRVIRVFLKRDGEKMLFCLNLDLKGPRIIISPFTSIHCNLFG